MIRGIHGLLYSSDTAATRAFFRDKVKLPGSDIGGGWWIFDFPEGDLGVHPAEAASEIGTHNVSFYCDDIAGTVRDMKKRGVVFTAPIADHGYGLVTYFKAPGGIKVQLYEPRYVKGKGRGSAARKSAAKSRTARRGAASKRSKTPARRQSKRAR